MLYYVVTFFILAVVSGILGFGNLSSTFSQIAKILAIIFLALLILSTFRYLIL